LKSCFFNKMSLFSDMSKHVDDIVWKALADPTRRALLDLLHAQPATTGALCAQMAPLTRTAVMKHLDVLVEAELVVIRRRGRHRWNYFNGVPLQRIYDRWMSRHVGALASSLVRLKTHIEADPDTPNPTEDPHD